MLAGLARQIRVAGISNVIVLALESESPPTGSMYCHGPASSEYSACAMGEKASSASKVT